MKSKPVNPSTYIIPERQIYDLLGLFQSSQLIGLFGESGTGKSTLVKYGLIPKLKGGFLGIAGRKWKITTIRPGVSPLENLAAGIVKLTGQNNKQSLEDEFLLTQKMKSSNDGLKKISIEHLNAERGVNSLIIIDNFEDIFKNYHKNKQLELSQQILINDRASFIQNILKCISFKEIPIYFLIILRSDFIPDIIEYRNLYEILSKSQYTIPNFNKKDFQNLVISILKPLGLHINNEGIENLYLNFRKDVNRLKNLHLFIEKANIILEPDNNKEIDLNLIERINSINLYEEKLEQFYQSRTTHEQKLIEKIFKQITIQDEQSKRSSALHVGDLIKLLNISIKELRIILIKFREELDFVFEIIFPYQDRLAMEDLNFLPDNAYINLKNEYFIQFWPRLIDWIKQENDSKEIYKRLSKSAVMFDKNLTSHLRPPDLEYILKWYEEQKPDELWANQFDRNYKKSIHYLLESKINFENELTQKEELQKQKIRKIRKTALYISFTAILIIFTIGGFAFIAKKQETIAKQARQKAELEQERARKEKERADVLYNEAQIAMEAAQTNEKLALEEKARADKEFIIADSLRQEAETQKSQIQEAFKSLDQKSEELEFTVQELQVSDSLKGLATREAESARAYQEALNRILSLRNDFKKEEFQDKEIITLLNEVKDTYQNYITASKAFKGRVLPNNDLYQILTTARNHLVSTGKLKSHPNEIASLPNGIRTLVLSSTGLLAAGGDDGIMLLSTQPFGKTATNFESKRIANDRIRSMEFIGESNLLIGTVKGSVYQYNYSTKNLDIIDLNFRDERIVEKIIPTEEGIFIHRGNSIIKFTPGNESTFSEISGINIDQMYPLDSETILFSDTNASLFTLNIKTLQWRPVESNHEGKKITALLIEGNRFFYGMEDGNIHLGKVTNGINGLKFEIDFTISAHLSRISSLHFDKTTKRLFTASLDQKAMIYDLSLMDLDSNYIQTNFIKIEGFNKWIWDFELISIDNNTSLLTVDENGQVKFWLTNSQSIYHELFNNEE